MDLRDLDLKRKIKAEDIILVSKSREASIFLWCILLSMCVCQLNFALKNWLFMEIWPLSTSWDLISLEGILYSFYRLFGIQWVNQTERALLVGCTLKDIHIMTNYPVCANNAATYSYKWPALFRSAHVPENKWKTKICSKRMPQLELATCTKLHS